jgi:hypothetical protein
MQEKVGSKIAWAIRKAIRVGAGQSTETWITPKQHEQRRWPDLKQILETPSAQA